MNLWRWLFGPDPDEPIRFMNSDNEEHYIRRSAIVFIASNQSDYVRVLLVSGDYIYLRDKNLPQIRDRVFGTKPGHVYA